MPKIRYFRQFAFLLPTIATLSHPTIAQTGDFAIDLPVACEMGELCFVQQFPDLASGQAASDPFCGTATYDGHKGTDIRINSMADLERDIAVVAVAAGTVARVRDGEPDRLIRTQSDRSRVAGKECGNGLVINHEAGWQTQYCHLEKGSINVVPGQQLAIGDQLGTIGASGMAQFPHVHLSLLRDGVTIDPFTGKPLGQGCDRVLAMKASHWTEAARQALAITPTQIITGGLAGNAIDHDALDDAPPAIPDTTAQALVGWIYAINLSAGDRISISVYGPDGTLFARDTTDLVNKPKASYSIFSGRRGAPEPGSYEIKAQILRDNRVVVSRDFHQTVQ